MCINSNFFRSIAGLLLTLINISTGYSQSIAHLLPKKGLQVTTRNLSWLTGSEISFFSADKKQHHYYFTWWEQDADTSLAGNEKLFLGSRNTAVDGSYLMQQKQNKILTSFNCQWNLKSAGIADIVYAKIWLPFLSEATLTTPDRKEIKEWTSFNGNELQLNTAFGSFLFRSNRPFKIKSAANLQPGKKDYARREQFLIMYEDNIRVDSASNLYRYFSIEELLNADPARSVNVNTTVQPEAIADSWKPDTSAAVLLPKPKSVIFLPGKYIIPEKNNRQENITVNSFRKLLSFEWQLGESFFPVINTSYSKSLPKEGYQLNVTEKGINIQYHSKAGLQMALNTLARLVKNENGHLIIPAVKIIDWPSVDWRGIHMFTGPSSWSFHRKMYDRILLPMKMNKVVLQCEQAQWKSRPELSNPISVPLNDLKKEFDYLRYHYNEPIPLIQSLGHMEWFFKPQQNRWMAINPEYPYTLNPALPQAKEAVKQLWDETFQLLHPTTMHIGFDEIGMIGFNQPREKEVEYFKTQIDFLHKYALSKKAKLMLWGDMGLAPGEGPDALNGVNKERAATIRSYIPRGSYVADWHYLNNPDPEVYKKNLRIWNKNGNRPVASPWFWPGNIRGFILAAIDEKAGVLQTTWADFESSEKNMLLNIEQFGAYILALDYAWSGRKDLPSDLPYNAIEEWVKRFYSKPKPVKARNGYHLSTNIQLKDITRASAEAFPDTVTIHSGKLPATGFCLNGNTAHILPEGTVVAEVRFLKGNEMIYRKELRYGVDIRAGSDERMIYACNGENNKQLVDFFEQLIQFDKIVVVNIHPASGLKLDEIILIGE